MKKLTIVTINLNNKSGLIKTLSSLQNQTAMLDIHHIVIDGNSNDGSKEVLYEYKRNNIHSEVVIEQDLGIYYAMNKGLSRCKTAYIAYLNSGDELCAADTAEKLLQNLNDIDFFYSDIMIYKGETLDRKWYSGSFSKWKLYFGWMPPHPATIIRTSLVRQVGGFDTGYKIAADYKLMLKVLLTKNLKVQYLPVYTVRMEGGGLSNMSVKNIVHANMEVLLAWSSINKFVIPVWLPFFKICLKLMQKL